MGLEPALPLSLHGLLLARLDELPLTYQDILKRAAVMGMSFEEAGLVRLCRPQIGEVEVAAALDELERISFLTAAAPASYQFYHPLMQEAIYATLAYTQRQHWHTRIGDWLVESQTEPEYGPELIAYHYLHGAEMAKAARYGRLAGDRARERGAYAGAIEYYVKVLTLTNTPLDERIRAAEGRADVLALQGDYRAARRAYTEAMTLGSVEAQGKQAILSGKVEILAQTDFSPALRPWADGAHAWLLAQQGQWEAATKLVQTALTIAGEAARPALETLARRLASRELTGQYDEWVDQFAQTVLSQSSLLVSLSRV
jgi:predicted ATPase